MHKHTYEAYKDMIKVQFKLLQLGFRDYKIEKQKMPQKIEHLWKRTTQCHKSIHLALEVKTFFGNATLAKGSSMKSST
jgi:primosomal protein N''